MIPFVTCPTIYLPGHDQGEPVLASPDAAGYDLPAILSRPCQRTDKSVFFSWLAKREDTVKMAPTPAQKPQSFDNVISWLKATRPAEIAKIKDRGSFPFANLRLIIKTGETILVPLGIQTAFPVDRLCLLFARASSSVKEFRLGNCVGVIDADYRGEWFAAIRNDGANPLVINHGDKIVQAVFGQRFKAEFPKAESLPVSIRGEGGFGSTDAPPAPGVDPMEALTGSLSKAEAVALAESAGRLPLPHEVYDEPPPDSPVAAAVRESMTESTPAEEAALDAAIAEEDAELLHGIDLSGDASTPLPGDDGKTHLLEVKLLCGRVEVGPVCKINPVYHGKLFKKGGTQAVVTQLMREMSTLVPKALPKLVENVLGGE